MKRVAMHLTPMQDAMIRACRHWSDFENGKGTVSEWAMCKVMDTYVMDPSPPVLEDLNPRTVELKLSLPDATYSELCQITEKWEGDRGRPADCLRSILIREAEQTLWASFPVADGPTFARRVHIQDWIMDHQRERQDQRLPLDMALEGFALDIIVRLGLQQDQGTDPIQALAHETARHAVRSRFEKLSFEASHFATNLVTIRTRIPCQWLSNVLGSSLSGDHMLAAMAMQVILREPWEAAATHRIQREPIR